MIKFMIDCTNAVRSQKVKVTLESIMAQKKAYLNLYRQSMLQLYVAGLQSDPTFYNLKEARQALLEEGYSLTEYSGRVSMSEEMLKFELYKEMYANGDSTPKGIDEALNPSNWSLYNRDLSPVHMFYIASYLRSQVFNLDKFYDSLKFDLAKPKHKYFTPKTGMVSSEFRQSSSYMMCESILNALYPKSNLTVIDLKPLFWDHVYSVLGIEVSPDRKEGLFIKGISLSQEQDMPEFVLGYHVNLDGEYGHLINDWYRENVWGKTVFDNSFYDYVKSLNNGANSNYIEYLTSINFDVDRLVSVFGYTMIAKDSNAPSHSDFVVAGQVAMGDPEGVMSQSVTLEGLTGEFVSDPDGSYGLKGCPITIDTCNHPAYLWYDSEFGVLYGDIDKSFEAEFRVSGFFLEFTKSSIDVPSKSTRFSSMNEGLLFALESSEAGFFGPVFVNEGDLQSSINIVMETLA